MRKGNCLEVPFLKRGIEKGTNSKIELWNRTFFFVYTFNSNGGRRLNTLIAFSTSGKTDKNPEDWRNKVTQGEIDAFTDVCQEVFETYGYSV